MIEPEHIVLGLIRSSQGLKRGIVDRTALSLDAARSTLVPAPLDPLPREVRVPFSEATPRVFRAAVDEADGLQHDDVGLAHILLAVLRERESPASLVLVDQGLGADRVRAEIDLWRGETPG